MNRRHFLSNGLWVAAGGIFIPRLLKAQHMPMADPAFLRNAGYDAPVTGGGDVTSGLVGRWMLDDASGDTATDSVGTNHGTLVNTPIWTTGKLNGGLQFAGTSSQKVTITGIAQPLQWTWCFWVQTSGAGWFVSTGENTGDLRRDFSNKLVIIIYKTGVGYDSLTGSTNLGSGWQFLAGTRDGDVFTIYIDGVSDGSKTVTGASQNNFHTFGAKATSQYLTGIMDEIRYYNRTLSQSELQQVMEATGG